MAWERASQVSQRMKAIIAACLWLLLFGVQATQLQDLANPITRVVKLLQSLSEQIEKEGKAEEKLYEAFVCWGKSAVAQKKESNTIAESRIDALETYITYLEAGKIELTTERQDLEKEIEELTADLDTAKATRDKERKNFEGAKDEMTKAIKALNTAMVVLREATKDSKASLVVVHDRLNGGLAAVEAESENLNRAVELGHRFLSKADSLFLQHIFSGDVRKTDANMALLRKKGPDFKKAYRARSRKIQEAFMKLRSTFQNNLREAEAKETDARDSYDKLSESKKVQLKASQDALTKQEVENGARGMSKASAQEETEALYKQISNDGKFIKDTESSLDAKKKEWDERVKLREGEIGAISKAISILYSDDARDMFKKSYSNFLQEKLESSEAVATFSRAALELKKVAHLTGDRRLSALTELAADGAADPSAKAKFKPVLEAIDKMLEVLKSDEAKDLETKESCEDDRMKDTRMALLGGREIDEKTDELGKLEGEIKEIEAQIENLKAEKTKATDDLDEAVKMRKREKAQFEISKKEDQEAAETVKAAKEVLSKHYASFMQQGGPSISEGEAPPAPPATWDRSYGGKKGESQGIITILELVHKDILDDQRKAKEEEDQAQKEFDQLKSDSEEQIKELQGQVDKMTGTKGKKETAKIEAIKERKTKKGEWDSVMKKMKDAATNCEYYTVNFKTRATNRQIEVDGLNKAKAILEGGSFK